MLNKKILIISSLIVILASACASFGNVSMSFDSSKEKIWDAMKYVAIKEYGNITEVKKDPLTIVTATKQKDKEFGLDKTIYEAYMTLTGFSRPYVIDVEVRVYPDGIRNSNYEMDSDAAGKLIQEIKQYIDTKGADVNLWRDFRPY
jgi:hypothetical protein